MQTIKKKILFLQEGKEKEKKKTLINQFSKIN